MIDLLTDITGDHRRGHVDLQYRLLIEKIQHQLIEFVCLLACLELEHCWFEVAQPPSLISQRMGKARAMDQKPPLLPPSSESQRNDTDNLESQLRVARRALFFLSLLCAGLAAVVVFLVTRPIGGRPTIGQSSPGASRSIGDRGAHAEPFRAPAVDLLWPVPLNVSTGTGIVRISKDFHFSVPGFDELDEFVPAGFARVRRSAKRYLDYLQRDWGQFVTAAYEADSYESENYGSDNEKIDHQSGNHLGQIQRNNSGHPTTLPVLHKAILSCGLDELLSPLHNASEAYSIVIPLGGIAEIRAESWAGCLRALETFSQLVVRSNRSVWTREPPRGTSNYALYIEKVPLEITDAPRFPHRGISLDVARHFFPLPILKKLLQAMSFTKLNILHLHLTDSQSFPLALRKYPALSARQPPFRLYTERDIIELVNEAADLGIRVIPELDVPGHTLAWGLAIPGLVVCANAEPWSRYANQPPAGQLDVTRNETVELVMGVFGEIARLFPDPMVHIGADEINSACYEDFLPHYTPEHLQVFFDRLTSHLAKLGKSTVLWEDSVTSHHLSLPPNTTLQIWNDPSLARTLISRGYRVVMSPHSEYYLDCGHGNWITGGRGSWCDPISTPLSTYLFDPDPEGLGVQGGELALWTEQTTPDSVFSMVFPRALGAAGRLWEAPTAALDAEGIRRVRFKMSVLDERMRMRGVQAGGMWMEWCGDGGFCEDDS